VRYYHLVNLIIHIINAFLVWWLTLLILSSPALKNNKLVKQKHTLAFFTAMLFVSHPLATQAVTYIIQRQALMAAMFFMLSLAMYIKARLRYGNNIKSWLLYVCWLPCQKKMLTHSPLSLFWLRYAFYKQRSGKSVGKTQK